MPKKIKPVKEIKVQDHTAKQDKTKGKAKKKKEKQAEAPASSTPSSLIATTINKKLADAKIKGDDKAFFSIEDMYYIASQYPDIKGIVVSMAKQNTFKPKEDGLMVKDGFLAKDLSTVKVGLKKSKQRGREESYVVTDKTKEAIQDQIYGLYMLLVCAERQKITSGHFVRSDKFEVHPTYRFISAAFANKHLAGDDEKTFKTTSKSFKESAKKKAKERSGAVTTNTSIKATVEQMVLLNAEIQRGNVEKIYEKVEEEFRKKSNDQGKVVTGVFYGTMNEYSSAELSSVNSAKGNLQTAHNRSRFFYSTAKKGGVRCLYHFQAVDKSTVDKDGKLILKPLDGWEKSESKDIEAYAVFSSPLSLSLVQADVAKLTPTPGK